ELYFNSLSGSIPAGISNNLTSLVYLGLSFNNLTGVVPATSAFLETIDLSHNHFTRVLTDINAYVIKLSHNDIRRLPPIKGSVLIIRELDLSYNPLSKGLDDLFWMDPPDELVLNLGSCNFSGPFPFTPIGFKLLNLSHNNFTGPLPPEMAAQKLLETLNISHNQFYGVVPSAFWDLTGLVSLFMAHNQLEGPLAAALFAPGLAVFEVQGNAFSGSLPDFASWKLPSLILLDVSDNQLSGSIPDSISRFVTLQHLGLGGNNLSGPIPATLGRLLSLTSLNVSGTGLTCPADGSKCVVQQGNTTSFCRLCSSFCSSCTPRAWSALSEVPVSAAAPESAAAPAAAPAPAPKAQSASAPCTLIAAAINLSGAAAAATLSLLMSGM
ncbi:unnamed protein product, partial [Closterium sp. Naga37s-1]